MPELKYLTDTIIGRIKKVCVAQDSKDAYKELYENCHPGYKDSCEHYEEMSVHVYGTKPVTLLETIRPNEDPAIRAYRLNSYKPITKSTCKKAIKEVNKIFNPKLSSISFPKDSDAQKLMTYSMEEYHRFNSVINYMSSFALKRNIADANGIFLVQPFKLPSSQAERVEPFVTCYLSKDIHYIDENYALLFEKYEKRESSHVWFYTLADKIGVYNLAVEKNANGEFTVTELGKYEHNRGEVPYWFLGGEYSDRYFGLFESYFYPAVPFWDEVIMDHSDLRGSIRMHMFPQKWEVADECEYVEDNMYECTNGLIFPQDGRPHKCPACKGAGRKAVKSPYETYWVNKDRFQNPDGTTSGFTAPFGYVEPGTEATKMLKTERDEGLQKGLSALNMDVLNKIGNNQSGISKDIDRRTELQEFLQTIANRFFEVHFPNVFDWFAWYMFHVQKGGNEESIKKIQPTISKPTQFDVYSTTELTDQLKGAKEAKLNPSYLAVKQAEVQNKEFQTNPELLKILNLETELDPLAEVSREDIGMMLMNGTITKVAAIIHDNIRPFIRKAMEEDEKFTDMEYSEQVELLEQYADEIVEANKVTLDTTLLDDDTVSPGA